MKFNNQLMYRINIIFLNEVELENHKSFEIVVEGIECCLAAQVV